MKQRTVEYAHVPVLGSKMLTRHLIARTPSAAAFNTGHVEGYRRI